MMMPLTEEQQAVVAHMEGMKAMKATMKIADQFHYKGMEHFLLEHGRWYTPQPWPKKFKQGAPKQCFANAMLLGASKGLRYVEGLAIADISIALPIHHGWNVDEHDNVIDNTWLNTGLLYFGVEFSVGRADDAIWNGNCTVLDDYRRRHPLYRQPWLGEDYSLKWEPSEAMKVFQRMNNGESRRRIVKDLERLNRSIAKERNA